MILTGLLISGGIEVMSAEGGETFGAGSGQGVVSGSSEETDSIISIDEIMDEGDKVSTSSCPVQISCYDSSPMDVTASILPTIIEIQGEDSSTVDEGTLPDNLLQPNLQDFTSIQSIQKRNTPPCEPFLLYDRRKKLQRAANNSDYIMQQLNSQLALTQQYTEEIIALRKEQSRLEEKLRKERKEIAHRNAQLMDDLKDLEKEGARIAQAEAEVTALKLQYQSELQLLVVEKDKLQLVLPTSSEQTIDTPHEGINRHGEKFGGGGTWPIPKVVEWFKPCKE